MFLQKINIYGLYAGVFGVSLFLRILAFDPILQHDEYYHLLAARSWASDSTLRVADGIYSRTLTYTKSIGVLFAVFGESVFLAKLLSAVFGSISVVLLFAWVAHVKSPTAGLVAATLMCFSPDALGISQFIRFYALHGLVFFLGSVCVYELVTTRYPPSQTLLLAFTAFLALWFSLSLQPLTYLGIVALASWTICVFAIRNGACLLAILRRHLLFSVIVGISLAGGISYFLADSVGHLWEGYRLERAGVPPDIKVYHWLLQSQYPTLWTLFPIAVLVASARNPKPAVFSVTVFIVVFLLLSFAGRQGHRFLYFVLPFFFALWGIASCSLYQWIRELIKGVSEQTSFLASLPRARVATERFIFASVLILLVLTNPAFPQAFRIIGKEFPGNRADWKKAAASLSKWIDNREYVVVTTSGVRALYHLGRYDVVFNRVQIGETEEGTEFSLDPITGRPVISTSESLELLISCHPKGLFIDQFAVGSIWGIDRATAEILAERTREIDIATEIGVRGFVWEHELRDYEPDKDCPDIS
jgi:hypothetical protein